MKKVIAKAQEAVDTALRFLEIECRKKKVAPVDFEMMRHLVFGRDYKIKPESVAKQYMFYKGVFHAVLSIGLEAAWKADGSVIIHPSTKGGAK